MVVRRNGRVTSSRSYEPREPAKGSGTIGQEKGAAMNRNANKLISLPMGQRWDANSHTLLQSGEQPPDPEETGE